LAVPAIAAHALFSLLVMLIASSCPLENGLSAQEAQPSANPASTDEIRPGYLVRVPLPINSQNAFSVRQTIERLLEKVPNAVRMDDRPVIVLEFDTADGKTGRGSKLESCLELARFLSSTVLNRVHTVAYIPAARNYAEGDNLAIEQKPTSQLNGHAVLVAIAADEIAMHRDAAIGLAGADEQNVDGLVREVYRTIAKARLTLPEPMVMSMVDTSAKLYRVTTDNGIVYVGEDELARLERAGDVIESNTISGNNAMASFSSRQLADFRLIKHRVTSRTELARELNLAANALESDPALGKQWDAVQVDLPDYIDDETVQWVMRAINSSTANLLIFRMNSSGGDPDACRRLAARISELDPNAIRTVAFVTGVARGPAALVALTCDHLVMTPTAEIGGVPDPVVDPAWVKDNLSAIQDLGRAKGRDWSVLAGVMDLDQQVMRYREKTSGQVRLLSRDLQAELADADNWILLGPLGLSEGVDANTAEQLYLARAITDNMEGLQAFYQLKDSPRMLTPTIADRWVEKVARYLASPFIAPWLLFAAVFLLSTEMSAPGVGVPGFLGTLCLVAFFWSQHLDGNAQWLEIILFLLGVAFLLLEIFVLPGFGVFGIGGLLMVIVAIILASQSFIIPRTTEELNQLPISLLMVLSGAMGFLVSMAVLRKVLPNTPYLKRMMLEPPVYNETGLAGSRDPGSIVDWSHLTGRTGETITPLVPSGKARIDGKVYDVISDGRLIEKGQPIFVTQAIGNRIVVKPSDSE
jgi:membrane-bound ClpP family serine protease